MGTIRLIYKLLGTFIGSVLIILLLPITKGIVRILTSRRTAHYFVFRASQLVGKYLVFLFGIHVKAVNKENIPKKYGFLVVGNHIGYAELIAISVFVPIVFISKEEVKDWPILGMVFKAGGEVFVDRDSGGKSEEYASTVQDALEDCVNIFFAPEGTTSDSTILRRFKSPLFVPANRLKRQVLPFAFYPSKINGKKVTKENRDKVLWHSDMSFTPHFVEFLKLKRIDCTIQFGEPVIPDYDDTDIEKRREFAASIRLKVDEIYRNINPFYTGNEEYS